MSEAAIIKIIDDICHSGRRPLTVFGDWLDMTVAALDAMPRHAVSIAVTRAPAEDTAEVQALYARLRTAYTPADFRQFAAAYHALTEETQARGWGGCDGTWDVLGAIYMKMDVANERSGQYFTPWSICKLMANTTLEEAGNVEAACRRRVADAINRGPWGVLGLANGESITQSGKECTMLYALAENYVHLVPLLVSDVACGSGAMLLAAASVCPRWALDYAVIRFLGQDIDHTCVQMARANMMLYGLNGYSIRFNAAIAGAPQLSSAIAVAPPQAQPSIAPAITLPPARAEQGSLFA